MSVGSAVSTAFAKKLVPIITMRSASDGEKSEPEGRSGLFVT
jgi:hypothetical protein